MKKNKRMQRNRNIVLTTVSHDGLALRFASPELQNDKEVVIAAITNNIDALQFASHELQNDEDVLDFVQRLQYDNKYYSD